MLTYRMQAGLGSVVLNNAKDFLCEQINADKTYSGSNKTPEPHCKAADSHAC